MALACLADVFGPACRDLPVPFLARLDGRRVDVALRMLERRVNTPMTSSCGRLFDAVAGLLGVRSAIDYEAQAAIELEMLARDSPDERAYSLPLAGDADGWVLDTRPLIEDIVREMDQRVDPSTISRRFHLALVRSFADAAVRVRASRGIDRVCLSGGSFNNRLLLEGLVSRLGGAGFQVFTHRAVPSGDGGLALGQAVIASRRWRRITDGRRSA
jgi:hydrogenase maturation protein HypF